MDRRYIILIPPGGPARPVEVIGELTLTDLQTAVGGYIEAVRTIIAPSWACERGVELWMLANEEGKLADLPENHLATELARLIAGDYIAGTAVLAGARGEDFVGLTASAARRILREWCSREDDV